MREYLTVEQAKVIDLPKSPFKKRRIVAEHMRNLGVGQIAFEQSGFFLGRNELVHAAEERQMIRDAQDITALRTEMEI